MWSQSLPKTFKQRERREQEKRYTNRESREKLIEWRERERERERERGETMIQYGGINDMHAVIISLNTPYHKSVCIFDSLDVVGAGVFIYQHYIMCSYFIVSLSCHKYIRLI